MCIRKIRKRILIHRINGRIGKDNIAHLRKLLFAQPFYIVTRDQAYCTQMRKTKCLHKVGAQTLCRNIEKSLSLFHKDSFDRHRNPLFYEAIIPCSILSELHKICNRYSPTAVSSAILIISSNVVCRSSAVQRSPVTR